MKVLKNGKEQNLDGKNGTVHECAKCKTIIEIEEGDRIMPCPSGCDVIECPVCSNLVVVYPY